MTKTADPLRTVALLRHMAPETRIADLMSRLSSGKPVVESILFANDYPEVAARLRELVEQLPAVGAEVRWFELEPDENFDPDLTGWEISPVTLLNILESAESYK